MGLERCVLVAVITGLTVVVGLVLKLQPRDGQVGSTGGSVNGARETIGNSGGSLVILVDYSGGGTAQALLVPVHIVTPNVTAAAGARDSDLLLQRPRHRAGLSQHNLCPRPSEDRTDPIPREGGEVILPGDKQEASQNSLQTSTCAVSEESEEERSPGHGEDTPRLCFLSLTARPEPTNPSYMSP